MLKATVTSKGQITLPKQIREKLTIRTGDQLEFVMGPSSTLSVRKMREPGSSAGCAAALLQPGRAPMTEEKVKETIRKRMQNKFAANQEPV